MYRLPRKFLAAAAAAAVVPAAMLATAAPASATVHEIVAQWCSGQDGLEPRGISGGSNADNFAMPVDASGFVTGVAFVEGVGPVLQFNYDAPNSKVIGTGQYIPVGGGLFIELVQPDPDFPAFRHCPRLATG